MKNSLNRSATRQLPNHLKKMELSWGDRTSIKFTDGSSIFKYVSVGVVEQTRQLYNSGLIDNLVERRLLQPGTLRETGITDYPLVIEYPFIYHISYPSEWSALALKEVALAILEIEGTANRYGYSLYDPNPFNATIQNGHPLYFDYGSFVPIGVSPIWQGYDNAFRDAFLIPLALYERKLHHIAHLILREVGSNALDTRTRGLAGNKFQRSLLDKLVIVISNRGNITSEKLHYKLGIALIDKVLSSKSLKDILVGVTYKVRPIIKDSSITGMHQMTGICHLKALGSRAKFLKRLRRKVESLRVSEGSKHWADYSYTSVPPWERDKNLWTTKEHSVHEIMTKLNPRTVLDIGANIGWFSIMFVRNGASVVALDRDEEAVNEFYSSIQGKNLDVLPLVMDIRHPTPAYELNIGTISSAVKRFKSELVMALAVIHHIVSNQGMTLEHLVYTLDMFTEKYLLVEFVPVNEALYKLPSLTEENWNVPVFKEAFGKCFDFKGIWESCPVGRKLLLFQRFK